VGAGRLGGPEVSGGGGMGDVASAVNDGVANPMFSFNIRVREQQQLPNQNTDYNMLREFIGS